MRILRAFQSFRAAMRASSAFGRAQRMLEDGDRETALQEAQAGLRVLREPYVKRLGAAEGSALVSLTVFVEQAAADAGMVAASVEDLKDAALVLESIVSCPGSEDATSKAQLQYIRSRLAAKAPSAA